MLDEYLSNVMNTDALKQNEEWSQSLTHIHDILFKDDITTLGGKLGDEQMNE